MSISVVRPFHPMDSNIYLIIGERTLLVDTGTGISPGAVGSVRGLLSGRSLDGIVLTHCHADHIGGLAHFIEAFSPRVFAGPDARRIMDADDRYVLGSQVIGGPTAPCQGIEELEDGHTIDIGGHRLRIIHTPGHTSGGICLFDETTRSLFSGDTVFADGVGRTDFPSGDPRELLLSLEMLDGLDVEGLFPGHGPSMATGGRESIRNGIAMMGGYR